jgi:hypothetical protein
MAFEIEFDGTESLDRIFEKLPAKYAKKPVIATFRKGARVFIRTLRSNTPSASGETKKGIGVKAGKGRNNISISVGFRGGKYMPAYQKAFWQNYGTLANRDASHSFQRGRRSVSSKWKGGIQPKRFVERSWQNTQDKVRQIIESELENETVKFLQKHAAK